MVGDGSFALVNSRIGTFIQASSRAVKILPRQRPLRFSLAATVAIRDRDAEREDCRARAAGIIVEVIGPPGVGKTTLLEDLARTSEEHLAARGLSLSDGVLCQGVADIQRYGDLLYDLWMRFFECDVDYRPDEASIRGQLSTVQAFVLLDDICLSQTELGALRQLMPASLIVISGIERRLYGAGTTVQLTGLSLPDTEALVIDVFGSELGTPVSAESVKQIAAIWARHEGRPYDVLRSMNEWVQTGRPKPDYETRRWLQRVVAALPGPVSREVLIRLAVALSPNDLSQGAVESLIDDMLRDYTLRAASPAYVAPGTLVNAEEQADIRRSAATFLVREPAAATVTVSLATLVGLAEDTEQISYTARAELLRRACSITFAAGHWEYRQGLLNSLFQAAQEEDDLETQGWAVHELGVAAFGLGEMIEAHRALEEAITLRSSLVTIPLSGERSGPGGDNARADLALTEAALQTVMVAQRRTGDDGNGSRDDPDSPLSDPPVPLGGLPGGSSTPARADSTEEAQELVPV